MNRFTRYAFAFVLMLATLAGAQSAHAAIVLDSPYTLSNVFSTLGDQSTGTVTVSGQVSALDGQAAQNGTPYFRTRKQGMIQYTTQPTFAVQASGAFEVTMSGFECGQTYEFVLSQAPPEMTIMWEYAEDQVALGFEHLISCGQVQSGQGDMMVPASAGAELVAGVNWGTIISNDTSVSFNDGYLIPEIPSAAQISYYIEYGYGVPGQGNYNNVIGYTPVMSTSQPNYGFSTTINGLTPNTDYYFTLFEVSNGVGTNLLTYTFASTTSLGSSGIMHVFQTPTTMMISGHLENQAGDVIYNLPIEIIIRDMGGTEIMAAETVTGAQNVIGGGYFEHLFFGMTSAPANMVPGQQYTYTIVNQTTGADLTVPVTFTMPTPNQGGGNVATVAGPDYDGLVTCDGPDCDFNSFIAMVNRVTNFLIIFVAFPFAGVVVAYAGILLLLSGGSSGARDKAKSMIGKVIVGLIVTLLAWVIIKLVLVVFGYTPDGPLWDILGTEP